MTDYVNHNTALSVKELAKMKEIPLIHAKRSWSAVQEKLVAQGLICCN
jgi:hypothetical protein